jgi:hypothetical protein
LSDNPIIEAWETAKGRDDGPRLREEFILYLQRRYAGNLARFISKERRDPYAGSTTVETKDK